MKAQFEKQFEELEALFYRCEDGNNMDKAESMLEDLLKSTTNATTLARIYAEKAQAQIIRYDYVPKEERLAMAEKAVELSKKALEYDEENIQANLWAASSMGIHGMEMGLLSSLFYIKQMKKHLEKVLTINESYCNALAHQILGDLYRLAPPPPISIGNKKKSLEHLIRARELAPECPRAKLRLAEIYISLRKYDLAKNEIDACLNEEVTEHGPIFAAEIRDKAMGLKNKIGA